MELYFQGLSFLLVLKGEGMDDPNGVERIKLMAQLYGIKLQEETKDESNESDR